MDVDDASNADDKGAVKEQQKYNSTSSVYINSTITRPDIEELIFCVSVVIHDRIHQGARGPCCCFVLPPQSSAHCVDNVVVP